MELSKMSSSKPCDRAEKTLCILTITGYVTIVDNLRIYRDRLLRMIHERERHLATGTDTVHTYSRRPKMNFGYTWFCTYKQLPLTNCESEQIIVSDVKYWVSTWLIYCSKFRHSHLNQRSYFAHKAQLSIATTCFQRQLGDGIQELN